MGLPAHSMREAAWSRVAGESLYCLSLHMGPPPSSSTWSRGMPGLPSLPCQARHADATHPPPTHPLSPSFGRLGAQPPSDCATDDDPNCFQYVRELSEGGKALQQLIDYAASKPEVRFVTYSDLIRWMQARGGRVGRCDLPQWNEWHLDGEPAGGNSTAKCEQARHRLQALCLAAVTLTGSTLCHFCELPSLPRIPTLPAGPRAPRPV